MNLFGGGDGGARAEAARQQKEARRQRQAANEGELRNRQRAERGNPRVNSRSLLTGNLGADLKSKLGG